MTNIRKFTLSIILIIFAVACGKSDSKADLTDSKGKLSHDADKVIEYLLADWAKQFRSTDISTAMDNLGMEPDDELRLQIGEHFRKNSNLSRNLRYWGSNNYILNNDEKRIAKYIIFLFKEENRYPTLSEASNTLDLEEEYIEQRLAFLNKAGLMQPSDNEIRYSLVDNYNTWGGPLKYNYHTVTVEGEKPFGVW